MIKIAYIINQLRRTGPVLVLRDIIQNLDRTKFKPLIIRLRKDDSTTSLASVFELMGVEIIGLNYSFMQLELSTRKVSCSVDTILKKNDIDIVHTHGYHPVLVASLLKSGIPTVETAHNISAEDYIYSKGRFLGNYMNIRYLQQLERINHVAAISRTVQDFYSGKLNKPMIHVIYNGINTAGFKRSNPEARRSLRKKFKIPLNSKVFLVIGVLNEIKDPKTIIEAYKRLFDGTDICAPFLLFLGAGPLMKKCRILASDYPRIQFNGFTQNVDEYLQMADWCICASHSEGFGLNFMESLMSGVPVVSSDIATFRELLEFYPVLKGYSFPAGDSVGLAQKMNSAMMTSINMINIFEDVKVRFSALTMAKKYMSLYEKMKI